VEPERPDDVTRAAPVSRRDRQRAEIERLVGGGHLGRAADLAHEHLADFRDDQRVRTVVVNALAASAEPVLRTRASEFTAI
jgi:hypothetical protein